MPKHVGLLVALLDSPLGSPAETPFGRAAQYLEKQEIPVIFGEKLYRDHLSGYRVLNGEWKAQGPTKIAALFDRFQSQSYPNRYQSVLKAKGDLPCGNATPFIKLAADKVKSQIFLNEAGIAMPEMVAEYKDFDTALHRFKRAFLKPRYGAKGRGILNVQPGDHLPTHAEGGVKGRLESTFLQKAILPPAPWAGVSVRVLAQRAAPFDSLPTGTWLIASRVVRVSENDGVVNVARGAKALNGEAFLPAPTLTALDALSHQILNACDRLPYAEEIVEMGIDMVMDENWQPHLIEINSRPRGRMQALAEESPQAFELRHIQACARPVAYMHALGLGQVDLGLARSTQ